MRRADGKADTVAHLVLLSLAVYADADGQARPGVGTLADDARLSTRATADALVRLQGANLIERVRELTGGTVVWRLRTSLRRDEAEQRQRQAQREEARRKHAERTRRYRALKADRDAEVGHHVTPNQGVTTDPVTPNLDARDAEPERHVTPNLDARDAAENVTTTGHSGYNCQELPTELPRTATSEAAADAPAADDKPTRRDLNEGREDVERLCRHLADRVVANGSRPPKITKKWRDEARLMLDKDGRTEQQVHAAIDWCQDDAFWRSNVLSMPTLRDKYDQLRLQAQRPSAAGHRPSTTDQRVAAAQALKARFRDHPTNQRQLGAGGTP